jgi:hypothetical protein
MNNALKLTGACKGCIITKCRFQDSTDRYETNCPADPTAHVYSVRLNKKEKQEKDKLFFKSEYPLS